MPLNLSTVTRDDISFGPARLFLGAVGATPSVDLGLLGEDGVSIEITTEQGEVRNGNPKLLELVYHQQQDVLVKVTSLEWNWNSWNYALGAGNTSASGTYEAFAFGGEPCPTECAIWVQHQMCRTGDTINAYVWRAIGEGNVTAQFSHDPHAFEYSWRALRADTDWASNPLSSEEQLIKFVRQI